jgi:uroporphyrinogen-III synthase
VLIEPLLTIEPVPGAAPDLSGVQAILLTSANAVPALDDAARRLPVLAVGAATARAARAAGVAQVHAAQGDAASLARLVGCRCRPDQGALLHLSGTEVRPGLVEHLAAAGFAVRRQAVYRAVAATQLSTSTCEALRRQAIGAVLLYSPRTAGIFCDLVTKSGLARCLEATAAICLSAAVAEACQTVPWRAVKAAERPDHNTLLDQLDALGRRC